MYAFALLMFFIYMWKREKGILPLVLLGPLLWVGSSAVISGDVMTFFREWSKFSHLGKYVSGIPVMYYAENLHTIFGTAQVLLFAAGVIFIIRTRSAARFGIPLCAMAINITVNTLAGAEVFHWTGSIGEFRYIAVVAPFVGIVSVYGLSEVLERMKPAWSRFALSALLFGAVVFNCTLTTHPRRWANYEKIVIAMTGRLRADYPDLTVLSNNCVAAYVMDVPPSGGPHFEKLDGGMLAKYPHCLILWDPYTSNPRFFQTGLTREKLLEDPTIVVVDRYDYWGAEYFVFLRNAHL